MLVLFRENSISTRIRKYLSLLYFHKNSSKQIFIKSFPSSERMVKSDYSASVGGSEAVQQPISARRTQSEKKREKNRRRNDRNKANPVYQARKKERDRKRRNAKKHRRDQANPEYQEKKKKRKNAKNHERDKADTEYQERKMQRDKKRRNAKKHQRDKNNSEYKERKKARQNRKKNSKKNATRATYSNKVVEYERMLKNGHDRVCVCCGQLFAEIGIVVNPQQWQLRKILN